MQAIGSTCNIGKITRKGQVEGKHRGETYEHQKLNWKGNKGHGDEYTCTGLSLSGVPRSARKCQKVLQRFQKAVKAWGALESIGETVEKG